MLGGAVFRSAFRTSLLGPFYPCSLSIAGGIELFDGRVLTMTFAALVIRVATALVLFA